MLNKRSIVLLSCLLLGCCGVAYLFRVVRSNGSTVATSEHKWSSYKGATGRSPLGGKPLAYNRPLEAVSVDYVNNIFFTIKTTAKNYRERVYLQLVTWFQTVDKTKVVIISDNPGKEMDAVKFLSNQGFEMILTTCGTNHAMYALCCKQAAEFVAYYERYQAAKDKDSYQWFCHIDDDVYVNIKQLSILLQKYDPSLPYYLGRYPGKAIHQEHLWMQTNAWQSAKKWSLHPSRRTFLFATGSTYCLSYSMMMKAAVFLNDTNYRFCRMFELRQDVAVGAMAETILGVNLTNIDTIHGQFEDLRNLSTQELKQIETIAVRRNKIYSYINIDNPFEEDKTKFMAYHCLLYPQVSWCSK